MVYCTHVDTSVGVRTDTKMVAELASEYDALSVVDGVAGALGEEFVSCAIFKQILTVL